MLLNIIICEADLEIRNYLQLIIKNYIKLHPNIQMKIILSTSNPRDVEIYMETHSNDAKFLLLGVEFPSSKAKGIELATMVRKKDLTAKMVFITAHDQLPRLIFDKKIEPLDFFPKNSDFKNITKRLHDDLDVAIQRLIPLRDQNAPQFTFSVGPKDFSFSLDKIDYFKSSEKNHNVILYTANEVIELKSSLIALEEKYTNFYRTHKSLLVNLDNIHEIDSSNRKILFEDGSSCDIARRKIKALQNYYKIYRSKKTI